MQKIFEKFRKDCLSLILRRYLTIFPIIALSSIVLQSCYSSTSIKGIPVKDLKTAKDPRVVKTVIPKKEKEVIALLSTTHGNKTFIEISGVPEYRIGPLDVLEINSRIGDEVTSTTVTVNNRGKISYSFVDDLDVTGLTPSQLDELLTTKLSAFIKSPRIDILVKEFNSKSATLLGELASLRSSNLGGKAASGRIYLRGKTKLMDLIAMAGGYTIDADIRNVKLVRQGKTYLVNLYDILEKGDERLNVIIDDGDVVDIPELPVFGEKVFVMGEVNKQGIYPLEDARDLLGAISLAGSITPLAKEENTLIVRGYAAQGENPLVMMSDVKALLRKADLGQNVSLEDGDLVYVPRMLIGDLNDWISNTLPLFDFLLYPRRFVDDYYITRDHIYLDEK